MNKKRAELHLHTHLSDDVSFIGVEEVLKAAEGLGLTAVAFTNLNNVQDFPKIMRYAKKRESIKVIYGAELRYMNENGVAPFGITVLAKNQEGIKELYKIISSIENDGACDLADLDILKKNRKNLLIGSCGNMGELYEAVANNKNAEKTAAFYDYFEIYPTNNEAEKGVYKKIYELGEELGVSVVATSNAHWPPAFLDGAKYRNKVRIEQRGFDKEDERDLPLRPFYEMEEEFSYLGKEAAIKTVYENPQLIADLVEAATPVKEGFYPPRFENAFDKIKKLCLEKAKEIYGTPLPDNVKERLDTELELINNNDFADIYYLAQKITSFVKDSGHLVYTRGAAGASFVAFLLGITNVNPLFHNIPFESFMGLDGSKIPDFDIVVPNDFRLSVLSLLEELLGKDKVATPGIVKTYGEDFSNMLVGSGILTDLKTNDALHPAGFMLIPQNMELEDFTPKIKFWAPVSSTHLDFHDLHNTILKLDIIESEVLSFLEALQKKTKVNLSEIDINNPELYNALCSPVIADIPPLENAFIRSLLIKLKPKGFDELLKIIGFAHGTNIWTDNGEKLIEKGVSYSDLPVFREDIMNDMLSFTDKNTAYKISEAVRKGLFARGKATDELTCEFKKLSEPLGDRYFDYCSKIRYIFTKPHAVSEAANILKLIWFKIHYEKDYQKIYSKYYKKDA